VKASKVGVEEGYGKLWSGGSAREKYVVCAGKKRAGAKKDDSRRRGVRAFAGLEGFRHLRLF